MKNLYIVHLYYYIYNTIIRDTFLADFRPSPPFGGIVSLPPQTYVVETDFEFSNPKC